MRLLHTSDWHVGRTFHGRSLLGDQEQVLGALADQVSEHDVDVVVVAGDLYDRAVPSVDSVQLATRVLRRIRNAGASIVVSSGNHDSAPRLGAFAEFLAAGGLHIRSAMPELAHPVLLGDEHGDVAIYGIPYLEPDIARQVLGVPGARGHAGVVAEAMRQIRTDLAGRQPGTRSVVLAHAFVLGGSPTESERCLADELETREAAPDHPLFDFKRGTVGSVPAATFDGVDYVALGHLHRRQTLAPRLRYSGAPLPYSFSEAGQRKGSWLVDLNAEGLQTVRPLDLPIIRPLAVLRGTLDEVLSSADGVREHYLSVELTDATRPVDPMRTLATRFPYVVKLEWLPPQLSPLGPNFHIARQGLPDVDVVDAFLTDTRRAGLDRHEQALVAEALGAIRAAEAAA